MLQTSIRSYAKTKGKTWLAELEAGEREKTGIKNLRIKYNKVFGTGKDAGYPQQDGKTPWSFTVA